MPLIGPVQTADFDQLPIFPIIPPIPPPPPFSILEILRAELPNEDDEAFKSPIPFYPPVVPPPPGPISVLLQYAADATGPGGGNSSFLSPVKIGSTLVYLGCKRGTSSSSATGPAAPNTNISQPNWGSGAWTDITPAITNVAFEDPRAYLSGLKMYTKIADSTSTDCKVDEYTASVCFEIQGATVVGATIVSKSLQAYATTYGIGSLATPPVGSIALVMLSLGANGTHVNLNPGVWNRALHADGFAHTWNSNSNTVGFNTPAYPETWIGYTSGNGTPLDATITDTIAHQWAGIAILLAIA